MRKIILTTLTALALFFTAEASAQVVVRRGVAKKPTTARRTTTAKKKVATTPTRTTSTTTRTTSTPTSTTSTPTSTTTETTTTTTSSPAVEEVDNKVYEITDVMPQYPGGDSALKSYLANNVRYPSVAAENGIQGRVVVGFIVERDGSLSNVQIVRSVDPSLDKEAKRVIKGMPRWIPGKNNGKTVRTKFQAPVSFRLE